MPLINQARQFVQYYGTSSLNLLTADFLPKLVAVHRPIPNTTNYLSFIPTVGSLNSFTTLDPGVGYFIDVKTGTSFSLPDAPTYGGSTTPVSVTGLATISITDLRNLSTAQPTGTGFILTDDKRQGTVLVDTLDTSSTDNNGTVFLSAAGQRFKRVYAGPMHVTWFDIMPNDRSRMATNSVKLCKLINSNGASNILFNGAGSQYYIGVAPENRTFADCAYCIGLIDFQGTLQADRAVTIITQSQKVGIHIQRTTGRSNARLIDLNISHDGDRDAGVDHGCIGYKKLSDGTVVTTQPADLTGYRRVYTQNWGDYKWNGINAWGVCHGTNITVSGYPGNGLCIFGATTIKFNGPDIPIVGVFGNDGNQELTFTPDDQSIFDTGLGSVWQMRFNNSVRPIGGRNGSFVTLGYPSDNFNGQLVVGTRQTVAVFKPGSSLFADSMVFDGINEVSHNGACGVFTTGDEANQNIYENLRAGDNGAWGVCDSSLLKNAFPDLHATANGQYFNDFSVNPPYLPIGGFTNRNDSNAGTSLGGHQYREGGNMGLDDPTDGTVYSGGGVFPEDIPNNHGSGFIGNVLRGIRGIKTINPDGSHSLLTVQNTTGTYQLKIDNNG